MGHEAPVLRPLTAPPVPQAQMQTGAPLPAAQQQVQLQQLQQQGQNRPRTSTGSGARFGSTLSGTGVKGECEDQQCAEECDPDECGDENRAPLVDKGPILPILLSTSTIAGGVCMVLVQLPLFRVITGIILVQWLFYANYLITLGCMCYAALCDPGQLKREHHEKEYSSLQWAENRSEKAETDEVEWGTLPKRAHKTWLYRLPIRRYDHYCRWLRNCIGLLNHREFIVMCTGLLCTAVFGAILDLALVIYLVRTHLYGWVRLLLVIVHFFYSVALGVLAAPILRLHMGFISRNELASEWKRNIFYVIHSSRTGAIVPVNELDDDEFNEEFDSFQYDRARNPFDKGFSRNCWLFWFSPRSQSQLGEF